MSEFTHRDGLEMTDHRVIRTSIAWKCNGRGNTINVDVFVGATDCDPNLSGVKTPHVVLALQNDIHHAVMTPEQAYALADTLIYYAAMLSGGPR